MNEGENTGLAADPGGPQDFDAVLQAELREVLPDLALPAGARATIEAIDAGATDLAALCLSGGGIRSATFALGVLQGLARFGLLGQFHYLSTVSGGGYIGSWLSAWRSIEADERIFAALNITPTLGLLSADTWTLVAVYIRNLILNWLLFAPFFMGCLSGWVGGSAIPSAGNVCGAGPG